MGDSEVDKLTNKSASEYYDPCKLESKRSMKCLEANNYNKEACQQFFQDYRDCKKKWGKIRLEERLKYGIFSKAKTRDSTDQQNEQQ